MLFLASPGLINPLLLVYLFFERFRRTAALVVCGILVADAILVIAWLHQPPLIGFYAWIAGIVLILAPRDNRREKMPDTLPGVSFIAPE